MDDLILKTNNESLNADINLSIRNGCIVLCQEDDKIIITNSQMIRLIHEVEREWNVRAIIGLGRE